MPTYEYHCKSCGHELEEFQSMTAKPLKKCPECGKNALERKIGIGAGVLFKGGGFYETDYRSDSYKKAAEADSKPASTEGAKTDTKPDAKADSPKPEPKTEPRDSKPAVKVKPSAAKSGSSKKPAAAPKSARKR